MSTKLSYSKVAGAQLAKLAGSQLARLRSGSKKLS
jgi:hypothetical protein